MISKKERYKQIISYFEEALPDPKTELIYSTPFELLVAVLLSAQCTDKRVNQVTPALFKRFPTACDMAKASFEALYPYVASVSYPVNKTRYLRKTAQLLCTTYQGKLPTNATDLQRLPGIGRKSAHVVASVIYGAPLLPVDTHVMRVSRRLGLVDWRYKTPLAIEKQLVAQIPKGYVQRFHHWLILHGRYICKARKPACSSCPLRKLCVYYQSEK